MKPPITPVPSTRRGVGGDERSVVRPTCMIAAEQERADHVDRERAVGERPLPGPAAPSPTPGSGRRSRPRRRGRSGGSETCAARAQRSIARGAAGGGFQAGQVDHAAAFMSRRLPTAFVGQSSRMSTHATTRPGAGGLRSWWVSCGGPFAPRSGDGGYWTVSCVSGDGRHLIAGGDTRCSSILHRRGRPACARNGGSRRVRPGRRCRRRLRVRHPSAAPRPRSVVVG